MEHSSSVQVLIFYVILFYSSKLVFIYFSLIFSVEFIGYFLDRDARLNRLKKQLSHHAENKARLTNDQQTVQTTYDNVSTVFSFKLMFVVLIFALRVLRISIGGVTYVVTHHSTFHAPLGICEKLYGS